VNRCFFVECPCVQFQEMCKRLEFKSESERLADILKWAEGWQSENSIRPHTQMSRPNRSGPPDSLGTNNVRQRLVVWAVRTSPKREPAFQRPAFVTLRGRVARISELQSIATSDRHPACCLLRLRARL
jgi:hypothetical protein